MNTWIDVKSNSDFSIYNIPFGIFSGPNGTKRIGTRIGDTILDLEAAADLGLFDQVGIDPDIFESTILNPFIALGKEVTSQARRIIQGNLTHDQSKLKEYPKIFFSPNEVTMHMPVDVKDYTDFYSSYQHAFNVGSMFRDPDKAIMPNWKHLPVGYHGRASSIIPTDVNIHRPKGQTKPADGPPVYGASRRLDIELEMAFVVGKKSNLGQPISIDEAENYIFGMVLFNDWSARDIQKWEYVPLGPFLGKSFASSISPWIVTMEALAFAKVDGPNQDPEVLPYLKYSGQHHYDIHLSVGLTPENGKETIICRSNYKYMYWNMVQQLSHHTVNGCNVNIGDMMASGTISGVEDNSYGSMLELSWGGKKKIHLNGGGERTFLEDHDTVTMYGHAEKDGRRVGFGEVRAKILPSL